MKKVIFFVLLVYPVLLLAQVAGSPTPVPSPAAVVQAVALPPAWAPPEIVVSVLDRLATLPTVGPWLVKLMSVLALVSVGFTILASFVMGLLSALSKSAELLSVFPWLAKLGAVSDKIDAIYEKVVPYLQFFSMYNSKLKLPVVAANGSGDSKPT